MSTSNEYLVPDSWQRSVTFDLELPQGGKVLARQVTMEDLAELGLVDKVDLFGQVAGKGPKKKGDKQKDVKVTGDAFQAMLDVINRIVLRAVVKPKIHPAPQVDGDDSEEDREPGKVYVDMIPFGDKMFIFEKCFAEDAWGEGMENFRAKSIKAMGAVQPEPGVRIDTKRDAGAASDSP